MFEVLYTPIITLFHRITVIRFERWLRTITQIQQDLERWIEWFMPPIDVLMVWHAYLLNPRYHTSLHWARNEHITYFTAVGTKRTLTVLLSWRHSRWLKTDY